MSDAITQYSGVIVYSMRSVALGFGVAAHSTAACKELDPMGICVLHQGDVGEYLRCEDEMFCSGPVSRRQNNRQTRTTMHTNRRTSCG